MIYGLKDILHMVTSCELKHAKIYENHVNEKMFQDSKDGKLKHTIDKNMFYQIKFNEDSKVLITELEDFANKFPYKFTVLLGNNKTGDMLRELKKVHVDFANVKVQGTNQSGNFDFEAMELRIEKKVEVRYLAKLESEKKELELTTMRERLAHLETWGGKSSLILEQVLTNLFMKYAGAPNMQGTGQTPTEESQPAGSNIDKVQELDVALKILVDKFGQETLIKFSKKLTPENVAMITGFANS